MPLQVSRLRRWFAGGAIAVVVLVAGAYYVARWQIQSVLKKTPEKLGLEIQQSAQGFTVSKSEAGRTIFKIQASKAVQYKQGGRAELHDVAITLYGRDSSRFDQIYGSEFEYDPQSGDVIAHGEVQIDLEANPEGATGRDQAIPKELKNPIHVKTSGLVFNQKTGNAHTEQKVEFRIPQATGTAMGATYVAEGNVLTFLSQVNVEFHGPKPLTLTASRGTVTHAPSVIMLNEPRIHDGPRKAEAQIARLFLSRDNNLERVLATGNVRAEMDGPEPSFLRAASLELIMGKERDTLRTAIFSGDVHMENSGTEPSHADAGRVVMNFIGKSQLTTVHAENNVKMVHQQKPAGASSTKPEMVVSAPVMDFVMGANQRLQRATTSGPPQIVLRTTGAEASGEQTVVTAGRFDARFDKAGQLTSLLGAPSARIVNSTPGGPDRVSTSDSLEAEFRGGQGIETIVQRGNLAYTDGDLKAWADQGRYTPSSQMLVLTGSPRVEESGMTTTARTMRLNRSTGDAIADGEVKSTYSDLKAQPTGALLASSSPIHVTARSMTARRTTAIAVYSGGSRLWQEANVVNAPTLEFDRNHRSVVAKGASNQTVSTVLMQTDKAGKAMPVTITSSGLTYVDGERKARFAGQVLAKWTDMTITARQMDVFFQARGQDAATAAAGSGSVERIVAQDNVIITQPTRRATGDKLTYTSADDKFVLVGGPPSIFDAEQGKITGVSLTLFRRDDRVLVEGNAASPVVTQTRVAR